MTSMQLGVGHSTYVPHVGGPALDLSTFWRGHMHTDQVDPEAVIFCLLYIYIYLEHLENPQVKTVTKDELHQNFHL